MFISETFTSIQGEGILAGVPSHFIRTSGCNLRCRWCDTPYASWEPEGERRSVEDLVDGAVASGMGHVVVTGGEPLIQREIAALTECLKDAELHTTIETAGTVDPPFHCDLLSLSPKTANSDPSGRYYDRHRRVRLDYGPTVRLLERFPEYQIKFVVDGPDDLPEVQDVLAQLGASDPGRVLLMPQGQTADEVAGRATAVADLCRQYGFRYTPRLHLDLYGGGRGV